MACFVVPTVEAIAVTTAYVVAKKKEQKITLSSHSECEEHTVKNSKISWSKKFGWLMAMLWGGVALLAFEHLWHGEIVPFPPFLTAMYNAEDTSEMLYEMATVGVSMAVMVTAVWGCVCAVVDTKIKKINSAVKEK